MQLTQTLNLLSSDLEADFAFHDDINSDAPILLGEELFSETFASHQKLSQGFEDTLMASGDAQGEEMPPETDEYFDSLWYVQQFLPLEDKPSQSLPLEDRAKANYVDMPQPAAAKTLATAEPLNTTELPKVVEATFNAPEPMELSTPWTLLQEDMPPLSAPMSTHSELLFVETEHSFEASGLSSPLMPENLAKNTLPDKESTDGDVLLMEAGQEVVEQQTAGTSLSHASPESVGASKTLEPALPSSVKAPEFSVSTSVYQEDWSDEFNQRILWLGQQKIDKALLQLHPKDLGPVQVQIHLQDNLANLHIQVNDTLVQHRIQESLPELKALMEMQGLSLGQASVDSHSQQPKPRPEPFLDGQVDVNSAQEGLASKQADRLMAITHNGRVDTYA